MSANSLYRTLAFQAPAMTSPSGKPLTLLRRLGAGLSRWWERQAAAAELRGIDDRDLRDMGINRGDIDRLFDPAFADEYAARGRPAVRLRRNAASW